MRLLALVGVLDVDDLLAAVHLHALPGEDLVDDAGGVGAHDRRLGWLDRELGRDAELPGDDEGQEQEAPPDRQVAVASVAGSCHEGLRAGHLLGAGAAEREAREENERRQACEREVRGREQVDVNVHDQQE
jgi:hypothetical protein